MAVNTSFGRLWPYCDARNSLVTVVAPVSGARFPVHAGIAPIVAEGLRRQERGVGGPAYLCKPAQCGAFNCRPIGGTNSPSNHSGGLAMDINWTDNPFRRGARYAMPEWVWRMWESLGFYWGGRYSDFMHIEWLQSPAAAAAKVREIRSGGVPESTETPEGATEMRLEVEYDDAAGTLRAYGPCEGTKNTAWKGSWLLAMAVDGTFRDVGIWFIGGASPAKRSLEHDKPLSLTVPDGSAHVVIKGSYTPGTSPRLSAGWVAVPR